MASVFKPADFKKYVIVYTDENGRRRKKTAYTDKRESERLANQLEETARKVRDGLISRSEVNVVSRQQQAVDDHLDRYHQFLLEENKTPKFADLSRCRLRKLFTIAKASRLREITLEGVQSALSHLRAEGRGLKTLNHYGDTAKMFLDWCRKTERIARNPLVELGRYNARTDVRHERRSISLDEFSRLLDAARSRQRYGRMSGELREALLPLHVHDRTPIQRGQGGAWRLVRLAVADSDDSCEVQQEPRDDDPSNRRRAGHRFGESHRNTRSARLTGVPSAEKGVRHDQGRSEAGRHSLRSWWQDLRLSRRPWDDCDNPR